jgi:hypothetical protein
VEGEPPWATTDALAKDINRIAAELNRQAMQKHFKDMGF